MSEKELRNRIKKLEGQGHTGATNAELDALNRRQTSRLSNSELLSLMKSRAKEGKHIGKLVAAARQRGLSF